MERHLASGLVFTLRLGGRRGAGIPIRPAARLARGDRPRRAPRVRPRPHSLGRSTACGRGAPPDDAGAPEARPVSERSRPAGSRARPMGAPEMVGEQPGRTTRGGVRRRPEWLARGSGGAHRAVRPGRRGVAHDRERHRSPVRRVALASTGSSVRLARRRRRRRDRCDLRAAGLCQPRAALPCVHDGERGRGGRQAGAGGCGRGGGGHHGARTRHRRAPHGAGCLHRHRGHSVGDPNRRWCRGARCGGGGVGRPHRCGGSAGSEPGHRPGRLGAGRHRCCRRRCAFRSGRAARPTDPTGAGGGVGQTACGGDGLVPPCGRRSPPARGRR